MIPFSSVRFLIAYVSVGTVVCVLMCFATGCEIPVNVNAPLQHNLVVFSVLSTDRQRQFVRVGRTFMPSSDSTHASAFVPNAQVAIVDGSLTLMFRDTVVCQTDDAGLRWSGQAYACEPFVPLRSTPYRLEVRAEGFPTVHSTIELPALPIFGIWPTTYAVLDNPTKYQPLDDILFPVKLGAGARGYIAQLFVVYRLFESGEWREERIEVPSFLRYGESDITLLNLKYGLYGTLKSKPASSIASGVYHNSLYQLALIQVVESTPPSAPLIFDRVVFQLLQVEANLYNYYMVVHDFGDPHSMRLDEPLFTNISEGWGLFGGYSLDSIVHQLPPDFSFNRR